MKTICMSFLSILLLSTFNLEAQKTVVSSGTTNLSIGNTPSSSVVIDDADLSMVKKKWSSYLKGFDGKLKDSKGEYFLDNAKIKSISSDTLDIYSIVEKSGSSVKVSMAINRNGEFLSSTSQGVDEMNNLLVKFAVDVKKELKAGAIKVAEKALSKSEKENKELLKSNDKLRKKIKDMKSSISDYERDIDRNSKKADTQSKEVESKKAILEELKKSYDSVE